MYDLINHLNIHIAVQLFHVNSENIGSIVVYTASTNLTADNDMRSCRCMYAAIMRSECVLI